MTTFQEPPLQSRRAARQSERADAPPGALADPNSVSQPPASSLAPSAPAAPAAPEPLNYATTSRPPLPQYDGQNLRPRRTAETPGHADLPPTEALPRQDAPSYRPTDYSPEGRRSVVPNWAPSYDGTVDFQTQNRDQALAAAAAPAYVPEAPVAEGEHTMTRRELRALREAEGITAVPTDQTPVVAPYPAAAAPAPAPVAPAPVAPVPVAPEFVAPAPEPAALVTPPPLVAPAPQPSTRLDSALAEFDALAAGRAPVVPAPDAPTPVPGRRAAQQPTPVAEAPVAEAPVAEVPAAPEPQDSLSAFEALFAAPSSEQPPAPQPVAPEAPAPSAAAQLLAPPVVVPAPAPEAVVWAVDPLLSAPAPQGAPAQVPPPSNAPTSSPAPASPAPVGPASGPTSVGHWSTQSDIDDAEQVNETTISRSVGVGSGSATSALVLPSVPEHTIGGPMNSNGDVMLTGSISLPHSFSATGAHPSQLDESDMDHLLDPGDHQVANTDSMPVRATRAISTHTASGPIITPSKAAGTRGFTILIVAASAMAVVVVGLLVAGLVSGTL